MTTPLRPATPDDAPRLATLLDLAGEGLPRWLWSRMAGPEEDPMDIGAQRAARESGGFSYRHAQVACDAQGSAVSMLLGYRLGPAEDEADILALPPQLQPLVRLEGLAAASWYVNAVATLPEWQGRGLGRALLASAEQRARGDGCRELSLIVASENAGAVRLYQHLDYVEAGRVPVIEFPGCLHAGDWVLMRKRID